MAFLMAMSSKTNVHGPASYMMNTGFLLPGFPCFGSWVSYALGSLSDNLPDFIVLPDVRGLPYNQKGNFSAGFLPARHQGTLIQAGSARPAIQTRADLQAAFRAAEGIYFPDPKLATAGIHFFKVLQTLGLDVELADRFRTFPNGATAMAAMAKDTGANLIGCTQVTEINYTEGVDLVDVLPAEFELSTDYTLGICTNAQNPAHAELLADLLTGAASAAVRKQGGFEF